MRTSILLVAAAGLCAMSAAIACSSESATPAGGVGGGGPTGGASGDGGSINTGGSGNAGGSAGSSGSAGTGGSSTPANFGYISAMQSVVTVQGTEYVSSTLSAAFIKAPSAGSSGWTCTTETSGSCKLNDCSGGATDGGTLPPEYASAGIIHVTAGSNTLTLTPDANATYAMVTSQSRLWNAGQPIDFQAAGDVVPAFSATLPGIDPVVITVPVFPAAGAALSVNRSNALSVAWSNGVAGSVFVMLASSGSSQHTLSVTCDFDASAGSGSVPSSLLAKLPATGQGSLSVNAGALQEQKQGDWQLNVQEYVPAVQPSGTSASTMVTS